MKLLAIAVNLLAMEQNTGKAVLLGSWILLEVKHVVILPCCVEFYEENLMQLISGRLF